jgi:6-phosphogluconolactonase
MMSAHSYRLHEFSDRALWASALAQSIAWDLQQALEQHPHVSLGMSGGSTPWPVYQQLARSPLPWNRISAVVVDERFVDTQHADSNERALREAFTPAISQGLTIIGLRGDAATLENAADQANVVLMQLGRGLDVLVLGMGEDGHTASLFPTANNFSEAIKLNAERAAYAMQPMPAHAPHNRISMSLAFLRRSTRAYLAIHGENKRKVLEQAAASTNAQQLPISAWFQAGMPKLNVFWSS